jgi:hypothetical protein
MEIKINDKTIYVNDVLKVNCSVYSDNLTILLEHLITTDKNALIQIQDMRLKHARLEEESKRNEEIRFRLSMQERKINELFEIVLDSKNKTGDIQKNIKNIDTVIDFII